MCGVKIGALTIGQSPRADVLPEMEPFLQGAEVLQAGALDELTPEEMRALAPEGSGDVLVSRLRDGSWLAMSEQKVIPLLRDRAERLCAQGAELIMVLCTGKFPEDALHVNVPVVYPQRLLYGIVPLLAAGGRLGVVTPDERQVEQVRRNWQAAAGHVTVAAANPYREDTDWNAAATQLEQAGVEWIVLDCIGYRQEQKAFLRGRTGKPVILPRTLLARLVGEIL